MQECPICRKTAQEQKSWMRCPKIKESVCMSHCCSCEHLDSKNGRFHCIYNVKSKSRTSVIDNNGKKEIIYHLLDKKGINFFDISKLREKKREFMEIRIVELSEYHIRLEYDEEYVLCSFFDELFYFEKNKRKK